jgi:hypothetical protein
MNLFYKIYLQAFNVFSIVLYHSGPTFEQVLFSCMDAFVVDASSILGTSQSLVGSSAPYKAMLQM